MSDILLNCVYFAHLMTIFCTFQAFLASCIRLFDRLSDIGVFSHRQLSSTIFNHHQNRTSN